jgi:NAD(P)-dependent dehydrogenase (short-subunit alcohol dehydrogenase family)
MSTELRFDGQAAVITGAAGGIGRAHALLLAARGARVLVNDAAVGVDGRTGAGSPADAVVAEIAAAGGEAVADHHDVATEADAIVAHAVEAFGRLDVLIPNAGIAAGGGPITQLTDADFGRVLDTHLGGTLRTIRAAWPHLAATGGRVVTTSSGTVFGTRNTIPYLTAKSALIGLTRALGLEGAPDGIRVNGIMPAASTRMFITGEDGFDTFLREHFPADDVARFTAWLAHAGVPVSGELFSVGGGWAARVALAVGQGWGEPGAAPEAYAEHAGEVLDLAGALFPPDSGDEFLHRQRRLLGRTYDLAALH